MGQLIVQGTGVTDTYLEQDNPTTNFGSDTNIPVGHGSILFRTLIKFDISSIPAGAVITDATITFVVTGQASSNARTLHVFRVKRVWVEGQATWNIYSTGNNWGTAGVADTTNDRESTDIGSLTIPSAPVNGTVFDIPLTAAKIQEMITGGTFINNGFLLQVDTETADQVNYASTENSTSGNRPKLVVNYTVSSPSASTSPSSSVSPSVSPSISPSSSLSPSASKSPSSSNSPSISPSTSTSASVSPSPSQGFIDYTRSNEVTLPANDNDLPTLYSDLDIAIVSKRDKLFVGQEASFHYMIHQFKVLIGEQDRCKIEWEGKSSLAPESSPVYLQIFNHLTNLWETIDTKTEGEEDHNFELEKKLTDLANYKNIDNIISCRVYQLAI